MTLALSQNASADVGSFADYLSDLKREAVERFQMPQAKLDTVFPDIKAFRLAKRTSKDDLSPERLDTYLRATLTDTLVAEAKFQHQLYQDTLNQVAAEYDVPPRFLVALWGLASQYGRESGRYPVLSVTASRAFAGDREPFFREQFFAALSVLIKGQYQSNALLADADGRMGQCRMLPSDFLAFGQDGDQDGQADIWSNPADVFASIAATLKSFGWRGDETWGRQVKIPDDFDLSLVRSGIRQGFSEWQALGVRRFDGRDLPARSDMKVAMLMPDGPKGRVYLVYDNFQAIKRWRNDDHFAIAVVHLSDRIKFQLGD